MPDTRKPDATALLESIRRYCDEALHSGEVPDTLDEIFADMRLWIENDLELGL